MHDDMDIKTKINPLAVISGGTGYLGSAVRDALTTSGWRVAVLGRHLDESDLEYRCDITIEEEVLSAVKKITNRYGAIAACIHAAAPAIDNKAVLTLTPEAFNAQMDTAARGAFLLAKAALPYMSEQGAFIGITTKLIESGTSIFPMGSYILAKYALRGFLRILANETRSKGIRVYAVAPGFLPGGLNKDMPESVINLLAAKSGIGKTSAKDIADLIKKLCANEAGFPSGSSIALPSLTVSPL